MRLVVTFLVTAIMAVHAGLGCCAHHEHYDSPEVACESCHHGHNHHDAPADEHPASQNCDEEQCVFVGSRSVTSAAADLVCDLVPLHVVLPLDTKVVCIDSLGAWEVSLHPAGPALHIWHGILVI
jgi:hypothetical protein